MTDSYGDSQQGGGQAGRDGARRRGPGNREGGGFRIRLSDNEMRSVRALQEAFNLRSTVAVLGFAVRSLGQMLEDGQLDALIEQQKSQAPRGGGRRSEGRGEAGRGINRSDAGARGNRPDPFARPAKPQAAAVEVEAEAPSEATDAAAADTPVEASASEAEEATTDDANTTQG